MASRQYRHTRIPLVVAAILLVLLGVAQSFGQDKLRVAAPANRGRVLRNVFVAPAGANQPNIEPQLRRHLEPMLKVELSFACRAANLTEDERRALVIASVAWFDNFLVDFAGSLDQREQQLWMHDVRGFMVGGRKDSVDPHKTIQQNVAQLATLLFRADKLALYLEESVRREDFYRDVAIANLVERVDERLNLSGEQREKIIDVLRENWESTSEPQAELFLMQNDALPAEIEMWIRSELDESQRKVLNRINKMSGPVYGGDIFGGTGEVIDDIDLDAPEAAAEQPPSD